MAKPLEVDVYGHRLALQPTGDEAYVQELAVYVDGQMQTIARGLTKSAPATIAILAAMNIADRMFQQERRLREGEAEIERRAEGLLECIGSRLVADDTV